MLRSMIKTREKWDFFRVELTFELYESAMVFRVFIFILLLRTNGKKEHLDENDFRHCYVFFFSKVPLWKLLYHRNVHRSFTTIKRHIENRIWETIYSWRFYRNGLTYVLVLSWSNIMKRKLTKIPEKLSVAQCISRFTDAKCCYYVLIVHETFLPVNGEKLS